MWYDTSYMTSLSKENFSKTYGGFSALYIHMKVSDDEAYQSAISISASIIAFDMQGGSCSNIILYTRVTKWSESCLITPLKLHSDNILQ